MPAKQEPHEVRCRDRLDLFAEAIEGEGWMRAGVARTIQFAAPRGEATPEHEALVFQRTQREVDVAAAYPKRAGKLGGGRRAD